MPNRLARQTSPYLLQHAGNPVDWHPWADEAFDAARQRNVPIFLSVGYSTCYWCHVMERECFENPAIADRINADFIPIKVDREERPDVDELYMIATQLMTGHGGWPMTAFLDPHTLRPFWCGTYFPPEPRGGMPGLPQVLAGVSEAWNTRRDAVLTQAEQLAGAVAEQLTARRDPVPVGQPQVRQAIEQLMRLFDRTHAGFGAAPKFPQPVFLDFLLDAREYIDDEPTRNAVDHAIRFTLDRISIGGIHDHVGGGFHRYAVDATWTVPHFEKMLYDNAQLALVYARAARLYDDDWYRRVVRRTLDYVLREMTDAGRPGAQGFFSAQDAEVDHREGSNYLWTRGEFDNLLGPDAEWAADIYSLTAGPNFKDPHHPDEPARSVLRLKHRPDDATGSSDRAFLDRLEGVNAALLAARARRKPPSTDDKVLVSWNGLMINALAQGAVLLGESRYSEAAIGAAKFILDKMRNADGHLLRTCRHHEAHTRAFLEDHASLIRALAGIHVAGLGSPGFEPLAAATGLAARAREAFADQAGAYFDTHADQSDLFLRARGKYDGAMPSGCSLMLHALIDLAELTNDDQFAAHAGQLLHSVSADIARSPVSTVCATSALLRMLSSRLPTLRQQVDDAAAEAAGGAMPSVPSDSPVQVFADVDEVIVGKDDPGIVQLELRIRDGYHILAANPGPGADGLFPLRIGLVSGSGVAVYADYPEGEHYGNDGELRVHTGNIELTVALEHAPGIGATPGQPVLGVTFQACTETECLPPASVALGIVIKLSE